MSYKKPDGLLLAKPVKRIEPKSAFLKKLEARQAEMNGKLKVELGPIDIARILLFKSQDKRK